MTQMFLTFAGKSPWNSSKVQLFLRDQQRRIFAANISGAVPYEELFVPRNWQQCRDLKPYDRVEIVMPGPDGGRKASFVLECISNMGATGPIMAIWPYNPYAEVAAPRATEDKPTVLHAIEN
jgi:hypothetical protein